MKILITGGAGMVGSHAAEYYALKGCDVIVFDNLMRSKLFGYDKKSVEYNWNYLSKYKNIRRVKGDVRNAKDLKLVIKKDINVILHAAGQPGVGYSIEKPVTDYAINAYGTFSVLEHMREICPKAVFIYCSTNKVYGENVSRLPLKEEETRYRFEGKPSIPETFDTDLTQHTPYGVSKLIGDIYAQEYGHTYGIRAGVFRMSCIYGTRQFGFEDQGWLAHFIISNICNKKTTIYGDGKQVRDVLFVGDLIKAFDAFIGSGVGVEVFNIGGGEGNTTSLLEFLQKILEKTGRETKVKYDKWRPADQKVYISDIKKIRDALSWEPQVPLEEGMDLLIEWVRSNKKYFK